MSLLFRSRQRNPAVFLPIDEWRAGGDGDELRWELSCPKVSWRINVEENPTRRDRPAATVTKRETISLVPRRQTSVTALLQNASACHMSFYQGHLHKPLTEVSLKSLGTCIPMPLVRGRCRSLRVLVLLCRSSQGVVDRCRLQNEYPRHLTLFSTLSYYIGNVC